MPNKNIVIIIYDEEKRNKVKMKNEENIHGHNDKTKTIELTTKGQC